MNNVIFTQGLNDLNQSIKITNLIKILIVNFHYDLIMPNTSCVVQ